ncbi:hypothetical protein CRUP_020957 [Coryphaenoides rupestris]|nr:hypothetical protein CRUP_020957 [Coryphaenoides rupestris]
MNPEKTVILVWFVVTLVLIIAAHRDHVRKLEEQKADAERQAKLLTRQIKEEKEDWRRFQADLQTAVVVANDIKVEAQQELRALRRQLQEAQHRSAKLSADLEAVQGVRIGPGAFDTKTAVEGR